MNSIATKTETSRKLRTAIAGLIALLCVAAGSASASAAGVITPGEPSIDDATCLSKCIKTRIGVVGSTVKITGEDLGQVETVSFSAKDESRVSDKSPVVRQDGVVLTKVPEGAVTGNIRVVDAYGQKADAKVAFKIGTKKDLADAQSGWIFPVRGPHTYGDGIGADRGDHSHQGQDVLADCGTRLVAARGGKVEYNAYQSSGAGYYLVIDGAETPYDFVYMHLAKRSPVKEGSTVTTGQKLGVVGTTGSSSACHLHFEVWTAPGWYNGGTFSKAVTKLLKEWDSFS